MEELSYKNVIDIYSKGPWPSSELSNFAYHPFTVDKIEYSGMEGFLQGLKVKNKNTQLKIFKLYGIEAYREGQKHTNKTGTMWFKGTPISRYSEGYLNLITKMYYHMAIQNKSFRDALSATGEKTLIHSIGKDSKEDTIFTTKEFCDILTKIRTIIRRSS